MDGPVFKVRNEPRITRAGHFIRKTGIDELPQLWNILKDGMSMVGPRFPARLCDMTEMHAGSFAYSLD